MRLTEEIVAEKLNKIMGYAWVKAISALAETLRKSAIFRDILPAKVKTCNTC